MKKSFSILSLGLLLGMGLYSCSSADEFAPESEELVEIKLTTRINPATRGASLTEQSTEISNGQKVGITITGASDTHNNVSWTAGTDGELTNSLSTPIYYSTTSDAVITAYHPYNSSWRTLTTQQFSVQADQSTTGYKNSDLLWTKKTQGKTPNNINLVFSHKLAKINVTLQSSAYTAAELATATISICNVEMNTGIDLSTGNLSAASTSKVGEIVAAKNSATASAIVIPQTVATGKILIKVAIGNVTCGYTTTSNVTFESGTVYNYNMTLTKSELKINSSDINDWTPGSSENISGEDLPYNGYAYVDLGLPSNTLWATMNLGATDEYSIGKTYDDYTVTDRATLWNGWQLPTLEQLTELRNNVTWTFKNCYSSNLASGTYYEGCYFTGTSKINGNTIIIPARYDFYRTVSDTRETALYVYLLGQNAHMNLSTSAPTSYNYCYYPSANWSSDEFDAGIIRLVTTKQE